MGNFQNDWHKQVKYMFLKLQQNRWKIAKNKIATTCKGKNLWPVILTLALGGGKQNQNFVVPITFLWNLITFASVVFELLWIHFLFGPYDCDLGCRKISFVLDIPQFTFSLCWIWSNSLQLFLSYQEHMTFNCSHDLDYGT